MITYITGIRRNNRISELKKVIKKAREPEFNNFAPDRLKLLKLKNPVNDNQISNIQNLTLQNYKNENDNVYLMKDMQKIVTYCDINKSSSISSKSLLTSFIGENIYIKLKSGNYIYVQITSHLRTGKECIVFLVQVYDYEIKDAVLKFEISVLHVLSDLSCILKILFEGHTIRGSLALLTDFVGLPLESWISDNGNIDDYTIFQIILDLLSCLKKIHAYATSLQFYFDLWQEIIQDYDGLYQIIGIIKFGKKMSFSELIDKLKGKLKSFVIFVEDGKQLIKKKSI
ncbi:hypothetical protein RhiirA1_458319 [Rhizophagus irregularis]|uniref:Crinkler effector protein N-terminal domain-containing protein n=1 Tax=Rhizophagus irregularis TaxID=588596 RepID=A0A2N0RW24_9GLOM|nr:hypothetical protein RhiirA1_458319 [Rhizophagus irregularis]